ncbi:MAG: glutaminyl-peptide cyclotransferase [Trueperaceae bacterium]
MAANVQARKPWRLNALASLWSLAIILSLLGACASSPAELAATVLERYPHDTDAFTQGLLLEGGKLYESTGLYGRSSLREVDLHTGEVIRVRYLDSSHFGEGLAQVDERLIQLTWRAGRALVYDLETFEPVGSFNYGGEGWGLCFDGEELWMSDGSATLFVRDPDTFEMRRRVAVTLRGEPLAMLNELECVDDRIYANVWQTDRIVGIDKGNGRVDAVVDASSLLSAEELAALSPDAVLNGIAYDPQNERFLITGKLWPALLAVRFE